jgi:hypothetical protein
MKISTSRSFLATSLVCLLALNFTHCGNSTADKLSASVAGEAGEAGSSAQAGQAPASFCGHVSSSSECDPLTSAQCNASGQTCDYSSTSSIFSCYGEAPFSTAGGPCGKGFTCGPTTTCNIDVGKCQHYCCSDNDCDQGSCWPDLFVDGDAHVGVCGDEFADKGAAGAAGATGVAGESGATSELAVGGAGGG